MTGNPLSGQAALNAARMEGQTRIAGSQMAWSGDEAPDADEHVSFYDQQLPGQVNQEAVAPMRFVAPRPATTGASPTQTETPPATNGAVGASAAPEIRQQVEALEAQRGGRWAFPQSSTPVYADTVAGLIFRLLQDAKLTVDNEKLQEEMKECAKKAQDECKRAAKKDAAGKAAEEIFTEEAGKFVSDLPFVKAAEKAAEEKLVELLTKAGLAAIFRMAPFVGVAAEFAEAAGQISTYVKIIFDEKTLGMDVNNPSQMLAIFKTQYKATLARQKEEVKNDALGATLKAIIALVDVTGVVQRVVQGGSAVAAAMASYYALTAYYNEIMRTNAFLLRLQTNSDSKVKNRDAAELSRVLRDYPLIPIFLFPDPEYLDKLLRLAKDKDPSWFDKMQGNARAKGLGFLLTKTTEEAAEANVSGAVVYEGFWFKLYAKALDADFEHRWRYMKAEVLASFFLGVVPLDFFKQCHAKNKKLESLTAIPAILRNLTKEDKEYIGLADDIDHLIDVAKIVLEIRERAEKDKTSLDLTGLKSRFS